MHKFHHYLNFLHLFQLIKVELNGASNGGNLGADTSVDIMVPANDNPYGTVSFQQSIYRIQEPLEGVYTANITVHRRYVKLLSSCEIII